MGKSSNLTNEILDVLEIQYGCKANTIVDRDNYKALKEKINESPKEKRIHPIDKKFKINDFIKKG